MGMAAQMAKTKGEKKPEPPKKGSAPIATNRLKKEYEDHYPSNGLIEFMYGENQDMRSDNIKFKPEVGTILLFPSYLKHFVYPFYCDGERRSMSFNAHMKV